MIATYILKFEAKEEIYNTNLTKG
ncbi:uncharacterized protein METZ01_LOCUS64661 [marine metagenome]|uniref:Uncharacterized protein n=1 Tax=marine metagenome TaxID=408172 RepID=A0A381TAU7_9ZZZZ